MCPVLSCCTHSEVDPCTGRVEVQSGVWCVLGEWRYSLEYGVYWEDGGTVWSMVCTG